MEEWERESGAPARQKKIRSREKEEG